MNAQRDTSGFIKWNPINAHYVDPADVVRAMFEQSARTKGGVVAEFRVEPQEETEGSK